MRGLSLRAADTSEHACWVSLRSADQWLAQLYLNPEEQGAGVRRRLLHVALAEGDAGQGGHQQRPCQTR